MKTIRAFVAIHLSEEIKSWLAEFSQMSAAQVPSRAVRWVKPERMHLTLRFLGETELDKLPLLAAGLDRVAAQHRAFQLGLGESGCFPNSRRPRVLWVGVQGDVERLRALKHDIDQMLEPLGWPEEDRSFQAHLTLGRVRDSRALRDFTWGLEVEPLSLSVAAVHLIESKLRPSGPVYTVRHSSALA